MGEGWGEGRAPKCVALFLHQRRLARAGVLADAPLGVLLERLLRIASPLGLYAEEFEVERARHLGNVPQAFSHLALIEAAARIILADRLGEMSL